MPFCKKKCSYCAFYSECARDEDIAAYVENLLLEIERRAANASSLRVSSVYFGGGTPSLLSPEQLERILDTVCKHFCLLPQAEITLEANPESARRAGFLAAIWKLGITRVSFGVQSFQEKSCRVLGRAHTSAEALDAVKMAVAAGFENISIDLLWGLPGQSLALWLADLETAVRLFCVQHLSCYGLTLEDHTPLAWAAAQGHFCLPTEEESSAFFLRTGEFLEKHGFQQYEISNYARSGWECRHNLGYWMQEEYLGFGPSAVSTLRGRRFQTPSGFSAYADWVRADCPGDGEDVSGATAENEMVMLALRCSTGLDLMKFQARTGRNFLAAMGSVVEHLCSSGLARLTSGHFFLTREGLLVSDTIISLVFERLGADHKQEEYDRRDCC